MESFIVVFTTFKDKTEAEKTIHKLLKARLIACANIIDNVDSFFHWNSQVENEKEAMVVIKTQRKLLEELVEWIQTNHSYQVPEIIALPIIGGSAEYLNWIKEETT